MRERRLHWSIKFDIFDRNNIALGKNLVKERLPA